MQSSVADRRRPPVHPEPAPPIDPSSFWFGWASRLKNHPDVPRLVWTYPTPNAAKCKAYQVRRGHLAAFAEGGYDARSRGRELWVVHGRFGDVAVPALDVTNPGLLALMLCLARMAGQETHPGEKSEEEEKR